MARNTSKDTKQQAKVRKLLAKYQDRSVRIVPAVLATSSEEFEHGVTTVASISDRVHIDITDGKFAKHETVSLPQVYWGDTDQADLHLMMNEPAQHIEQLISMQPHLVIFHFEADEPKPKLMEFMKQLKDTGIKAGVGILQATAVGEAKEFIKLADHVLVFTGHLGHYGGKLSREGLPKIAEIKEINPKAEVSVDGGVNDKNARRVAKAGADVLITGSYTVGSDHPKEAYDKLKAAIRRKK